MVQSFKDKTVWITGASSGIGEALAYEFANEGAKLILSARRMDELERVKEGCVKAGSRDADILTLALDVTDETAMAEKVKAAHAHTGRIHMLINNAGISQRSLCVDTDMETYRKLFDVDVFGQIALTKMVLPIMLDQKEGHIAITSSVAGKIGVPYRTGYCAAKHAVMGFYDALRAEMANSGIRVTTITPGFIRTNISKYALKGDGSEFGKTDQNIAGGMDVTACVKVIMDGFHKGKPEIAVGEGREMSALWVKRLFPKRLFKMVENVPKPE
ncbi:SDR family oxidoreductase [Kordiimonas sp. SCSIO 12610]|uniref:SDR family oxidoreductase n=1 Tax=Kordiimonas sp. SCSIO 12610 TaxID=2829597 RepID=UPI00210EDF0C|nr:SDR family oxidoreductase [Kordiimonas sp. SCSIO 12610]UTW56478.1 SDR family oxidoreductase [Kordiimonas sp. SCSIO 12610]